MITYVVNVTNIGLNPDLFDITYISSMGWTVELYDDTWNPLVDNGGSPDVDTGFMAPKSFFDIFVNITIPPIAAPGDTDITTLSATSLNNNSLTDTSDMETSVPFSTNWFDGFESGWGSWDTQVLAPSSPNPTNWEMGDPAGWGPAGPYNGVNCIGTNIADDYYPSADILLLTPHVMLSSSAQMLSFYHWYEMDTNNEDGGFVEISASGGPWTQIYPVDGYGQNGFMGGYFTEGYSGSQPTWEYEEFDLGAYLGQIVQVRFHFAASMWWGDYGWYIDDVYIGDPPPYRCDLWPDYQMDYGYPTFDVDHIMTVDNKGSSDDTYDLASMSIWPMTFRDIGDTMDITSIFVTSGNSEDFIARVTVDALANPGDFDIAYMNASSQNDPGVYETAGARTQVPYVADWFFDFTPGWDVWTQEVYNPGNGPTYWEIGDPMGWGPGSAYSGINCAGTNIADDYYTYADIMLVSPFVELGAGQQLLSFMHWYDMDTMENEGGFLEINSGGGWNQIYPVGGYPDWGMMGGYWTDGYTGISSGWEYAEFDLSAYANSVVQVRFHFASWDWAWLTGWYVDDVYLGAPPPFDCELLPEYNSDYGYPATFVDHILTIDNTGSADDTYDLVAMSIWPVTFRDIGDTMDITTIFVTSGNSEDFIARVPVDLAASPGDFDYAGINASSQNDPNVYDVSLLRTQVPYNANWFDDFAAGWDGWTQEVNDPGNPLPTYWDIGDPMGWGPGSGYGDTNCAGTNIADSYYMYADIMLVSPYVELGPSPQLLTFMHWYEMDSWEDEGGFLEIDDGFGWTQIYPVGGYPDWGWMGSYNTDGYTGFSAGWEYAEFDLSAYAGAVVQVRFHFASWDWGWQDGWYVDDVYLGGPPPYRCDLWPDFNIDYGYPSITVDHILTIDNTGANDDTYDLTSTSTWPVTFRDIGDTMDITSIFIFAGTSGDFIARVNVDALANPGDYDVADINASSQNDPMVYDVSQIQTQVPYNVDWFDDFSAGWGAWTQEVYDPGNPTTYWEIGDPMGWGPGSAYSGSDCAGTNIADDYYWYSDIMLVTPYVELGPSPQLLSFMHWYEMDTWEDEGGFVEINDGGGWTQIYPVGGYPDWGMMGNYWTDGYTGFSSGWEYAEFDLSAYANSVVQVRFHFASWDWGWQSGWYVDDVFIGAPPQFSCDLTPIYQGYYGYPSTDVDHVMTIENTGMDDDTYDISSSMNVWPVTFRDILDTMDITTIFVSAGNTEDFIVRVTVDIAASPGDIDYANITITSQGDSSVYDYGYVGTQVPHNINWLDGFESGWSGWMPQVLAQSNPTPTEWEIGDPAGSGPGTAYNGANCAGTNVWDDYYWDADISLSSPYVELGSGTQLLWFNHWYDMDTFGDDGGFVEISASGGPWTQIYPAGGYPYTGTWMGGYFVDGYSGISSGWEYAEFDVSAYANQVVQIRFHFAATDWWGGDWGWYVDDVYLGDPPPYVCDLLPDFNMNYGYPTWDVDHILTADNIGSSDDTYDLSSLSTWPVTFRDIGDTMDITTLFVASGTSEDFIARVTVDALANPGDYDSANINISSQNDPVVYDESWIRTQVPYNVNWVDGFESGWGGWTQEVFDPGSPTTYWEINNPMGSGPGSAYSGSNCAGTNIWNDYYPNADIMMNSPYVELGSGVQLLSFYQWYEMDTNDDDGSFIEISVSGGPWTQINPTGGYPSTGGWMGGYFVDGYSGMTSGWEFSEFDVSAYANQVVQVRFHFAASPWWGWQWGWYVDEVYMGAPPPYRCDLLPDETGGYGYPTSDVDYVFTVNNTGSSDDTYDLTSSTVWPVTFRDAGDTMDITTIFVTAGTTEDIIVRVTIPAGAQPGEFDFGTTGIISQNDPASNDTSTVFTMVPITAPFFDDIEGGGPSYPRYENNINPGTQWEEGDPSSYGSGPGGAYSVDNCFAVNLLSEYAWGADAFLLLPYMDLTSALTANFTFWHWYQIDGNFFGSFDDEDGGWLEISTDLGYSWNQITPIGGYPDTTETGVPDYMGNVPCYASDSGGWLYADFDLDSYVGQVIMLRFRFWSEIWNEPGYPGWYIDDFSLQATFPSIPWVIETIPINDAIGIPESQNIVVIYSETMNTGVTPTLSQVGGPDPGGWSFSGWSTTYVADDTATWTHSNWSPGQAVNMSVSGAEDLGGNPQTQYFWNFTIDITLTTATALGPISGPTNIAGIFITYSSTGSPASVDLYYTMDTMAPYTWNFIVTDSPALGSYGWTIPADGTYGWFAVSPDETAPISTDSPEASSYIFDGTRPEVLSTDPRNGATDVPIDWDVEITFNETLIPGTFTYTIEPNPGGLGEIWSVGDTVITISHNDFAMGARIWVNITAATDLVTNDLDPMPYSFYFDTAYTTATATGPINGPTNVPGIFITYTTTGGPATVALYYTTDTTAPYTWTYIDTENPPTGSYAWTVPFDGSYGWCAVSPDESAPTPSDAPEAFWYVYDGTQPEVLSTDPVDTAVGVAINKDIVITFNETVLPGTLTYTYEPNPGGLAQLWSGVDTILTISHTDMALSTRYWVNITAVTDLAGNDLNILPYSFYFDTANTAAIATGPTTMGPTNIASINILYNTIGGPPTTDLYYTTDITAPYTWTFINTDNPADGDYAWTVPADGTYGWLAKSPDEAAPTPSDAPEAFSYIYDGTAPGVFSTNPLNGATGVPLNQDVVITFDEIIVPGSVAYTIEPNPGGLSDAWSVGDTVLTISHLDFSALTRYWVNVTSATDLATNPLTPLPYSFYFDTEAPDLIPPWVVSRVPTGGNVQIGANIGITFNESMNVTSVESAFSISPSISGAFSWNPGNTVLTFNPSSDLGYSTTYTITINGSIAKDLYGNYLDGNHNGSSEGSPDDDYIFQFSTEVLDTQPPTSSVTALLLHQSSLSFSVSFTASDSRSNVLEVELWFKKDSGGWGLYNTYTGGSRTITFTADSDGIYYFYTRAMDDKNNYESAPSTEDTQTIVDTTPPVVDAGLDVYANLQFTQDATVTDTGSGIGSLSWSLTSGPGLIIFGDPAAEDTTIRAASTGSTYYIRLTATDNAGNSAWDEFVLEWDSKLPTITGVSPTGENKSIASAISITFSEEMNTTSVESAFTITPAVTGTFSWSGNTLTFTPTSDLSYETEYDITIATGAKDLMGNALELAYNWQYTTEIEVDLTAPTVSSVSLSGEDVKVTNKVVITFSEAMNHTSVEDAISISPSVEILDYSWNGNKLTVSFATDLEPGTDYTVTVGTDAQDEAGNTIEEPYTEQFTTEKKASPEEPSSLFPILLLIIIVVVVLLVFLFLMKNRKEPQDTPQRHGGYEERMPNEDIQGEPEGDMHHEHEERMPNEDIQGEPEGEVPHEQEEPMPNEDIHGEPEGEVPQENQEPVDEPPETEPQEEDIQEEPHEEEPEKTKE
jgi:uncharacterized membrane protein/bacillopeptidase F (M6 metalloprotease family)